MSASARLLVAAAALIVGACAGPAAASITTTAITSPVAGPTIGPVDYSNSLNLHPITVTGTSDGTTPDQIDIACFFQSNDGTPGEQILTSGGAPVAADGSFSLTVDLVWAGVRPCLLRAVPMGLSPADLTAWTGPRIYAVTQRDFAVPSGPHAGANYDFYDNMSSARGFGDFNSVGGCGVDDMEPWEPVSGGARQQRTNYTFYCNGWYRGDVQITPGVHRSAIEVDGADVYDPAAANQISPSYAWPGVTHNVTYDPAADRLTIDETDPLTRCPANTPGSGASTGNCSELDAVGVTDHRTTVFDHHGLVAQQTDVWSTTGAAKSLDVMDQQNFKSNASKNGFQFPGEASMTPHTSATTIPIPAGSDPATILYTFDTTQGDAVTNPRASTLLSPRPLEAVFTSTNDSFYYLHYELTIPANGSVTIRKIYSQETTSAALAPLTAEALDHISAPSLSLSAPDDASTVSSPTVTVAGTASDNVGVASVTVDGQAVTLSGGTFSTPVTLGEGANTITVVAADATGATTTVTRSVTYTKPTAAPPTDTTPTRPPPDLPAIGKNGAVSCPAQSAGCTARATWRSRAKGRALLAKWSATIRPGATSTPKPRLTKTGRRQLRKHSVRALRVVTVVSGTGAPVSATAKVTLKRLKSKKKH